MVGRLKDINWTTGNNTETLRNVSTSQGLIQVIVRDEVPFKVSRSRSRSRARDNTQCPQVVGFSSVPRLEFAEFRSDETYITVRLGPGPGSTVCSCWCRCT